MSYTEPTKRHGVLALKEGVMENAGAVCMDCKWWDNDYQVTFLNIADKGECRRHAPVKPDGLEGSVWPETSSLDWCGDFIDKHISDEKAKMWVDNGKSCLPEPSNHEPIIGGATKFCCDTTKFDMDEDANAVPEEDFQWRNW